MKTSLSATIACRLWLCLVALLHFSGHAATNFVVNIDATQFYHPVIAPDSSTLMVPFAAGTYSLTVVTPAQRADATFQEWSAVAGHISTAYAVSVSNRLAATSGGYTGTFDSSTNRTIEITVPENTTLLFGVGDGDLANNSGGVSLVAQGITNITARPQTERTRIPNGGVIDLRANVMSETITNYQWQLNGVVVPDATNALLHITNAQPAHAADYRFIVSGGFGAITSSVVRISVDFAPEFSWARSGGSTGGDRVFGVATDSNGDVYAAGSFSGTANFGTNSLVSAGGDDVVLLKYDRTGVLLRATRFGGAADENIRSVAVDSTGNVYLTGFYQGGSATFGTTTLPGTTREMFLVKLDANGEVAWARTSSGTYTVGWGVAVDSGGNIFVTGYLQGTTGFGSVTANGGRTNPYVAKYDAAGNCLWVQIGLGDLSDALGTSVGLDAAGNIYACGYFEGTSMSFGGSTLSGLGSLDAYVVKMDSGGNPLWAQKAGGADWDVANSIAVLPSGDSYIAGNFRSVRDRAYAKIPFLAQL